MENNKELLISSPAFKNNGNIPKVHTGFDRDISPAFELHNLDDHTISIAIILDDLDIPFTSAYPHWLIWNIPKMNNIPENISYGEKVTSIGDEKTEAIQGMAYGKNRYRGPKQPVFIRSTHHYRFTIYALDCMLTLDSTAGKSKLIAAMQGHILQQGSIVGNYKRSSNK
jgi:Raf kinase inhibitor-like YbhB/YbcL family protein